LTKQNPDKVTINYQELMLNQNSAVR